VVKIYTRTGDEGKTSLFGGVRVPKTDPRVEAYGTVDELNSALGLARAMGPDEIGNEGRLTEVQADLFVVGAILAAARPEGARDRGRIPQLDPSRVQALESWIDELDRELPALDAFTLPGGTTVGAQLHVARTVGRRAERAVAALLPGRPDLGGVILPYLNRLSDLLFTLARAVNVRAGCPEVEWEPQRRRRAGGDTEAGNP